MLTYKRFIKFQIQQITISFSGFSVIFLECKVVLRPKRLRTASLDPTTTLVAIKEITKDVKLYPTDAIHQLQTVENSSRQTIQFPQQQQQNHKGVRVRERIEGVPTC